MTGQLKELELVVFLVVPLLLLLLQLNLLSHLEVFLPGIKTGMSVQLLLLKIGVLTMLVVTGEILIHLR